MSSLKVAVRCRPFNNRENELGANLIVEMDGKKTRLLKPSKQSIREHFHDFTFDYSYWSLDDKDDHFTSQEQVFCDLGTDVVDCAFEGYNACVFAYGQTGSGKTFTMMGEAHDRDKEGLVPRICKSLFSRMKVGQEEGTGYKTQVSYLEIYNERVRDLLGAKNVGHALRVREHRLHGPYVENLSQHSVCDFDEIHNCMLRGNQERTTASTNMNDTSSRSHAIFTITFVQAGFCNNMPSETVSKIHLVDLAGSERANATGATGQRLKEGAHINKSLVTLGSVISSLAEMANPAGSKKFYIPYRDSTLTWLLKDSLGGNSKTIMIAAISPADVNYSETLSTLRYANRAKNIINKPTINEDPNVKLIRELREEISALQAMLATGNVTLTEPQLKVLENLQKKEAQEKVLIEEWSEKWREVQSILREEKSLGLKKSGIGITLDSEKAHLIGINDEATGVTLFTLKEGETLIGTKDASRKQDIVVTGEAICDEHCRIVVENGSATIHPVGNSKSWLNANLISGPTPITQGDILLLGSTNMFRYNNPDEAAELRKSSTRSSRMDFSRLSLLAASKENLCNILVTDDDGLTNSNNNSSPYKARFKKQFLMNEQFLRDNQEIQDEHKKILETIESALKQLNLERVKMHEHFSNKVKRCSSEVAKNHPDKLVAIDFRIEETLAKQEMVLWEKNNEKTQVEILMRQINALLTQLDAKKREHYEFVAKELQELQDCGKLNEEQTEILQNAPVQEDYSEILLGVAETLNNYSSQYLKENIKKNREEITRYENELFAKDNLLAECHKKIEEMDQKLKDLEAENRTLLTQKSQEELEKIQMKKQSMTLSLRNTTMTNDVQTDTKGLTSDGSRTTETETCDTFHTANSDCSFASALPSPFPPKGNFNQKASEETEATTSSEICNHQGKAIMSDSGVCLDTKINEATAAIATSTITTKQNFDREDLSSIYIKHLQSQMEKLQVEIIAKKAQIMKILETGGEKSSLNDLINELQELQKDYVKKEMRLENSNDGCTSDDEISSELRGVAGSTTDSDELPRRNPLTMSTMSTRNNSLTASLFAHNIMTRSLPSIEGSFQSQQQPEHSINIPSYIMRGAGKQTHVEYEIRIFLPDDRWLLLRRFSRFRELHLSMKGLYGDKIGKISFPKRQLFASNSESVAKSRRRQLETYLRRLIVACSRIPSSPIYDGDGGQGLTKKSLIEFSSFFKKGLFESGKHGTG
ncbi:CLUMA_CG020755, isoform A [Clunio marinus]|uniref:CLUMA_CG020755, isoform A n=1 Tax=Clunio marinus TaxID=568069 RepID=A0A1J1J9V3_9DIPT|nr:CLUMA_CG020755, isoform A [Clunio marinus]